MVGTVIAQVAIVALLIGLGGVARRLGVVDGPSLQALSRLNVDLAFPALILARLLATVDGPALAAEWYVPLSAVALLAGGWGIGRRLCRDRTAAFLVGLPNWIFLPLLIAGALFGPAGERTVLLFNAGAQLALWTVGVATLTGVRAGRALLRNPGLWATGLGLGLALACPGLGALARDPAAARGLAALPATLIAGLDLFGTLAVPLALTLTGAQLAGLSLAAALRPDRRLVGVVAARLVLAPLVVFAGLWLLARLGVALDPRPRLVILLIAGMPVALSGAVHARRFGGDADLAARAVLASTLLALLTAPALVWLAR